MSAARKGGQFERGGLELLVDLVPLGVGVLFDLFVRTAT